jgi:hypothetical protein
MYLCDYFRDDGCYGEEIPPCCPLICNDYMDRIQPPIMPHMMPPNLEVPDSKGLPPGPPPPSAPTKQAQVAGYQTYAVDQGSIRRCVNRYIYIWPRRGGGFWAWLNYIGRKSVSGYKWNGYRWVYFGMDLMEIDSFECY